jgi:hypothetical protein
LPSLRTKRRLVVILSSISHTNEESCTPGLASSDVDIMILFPALRVWSHTDVCINTSHQIA